MPLFDARLAKALPPGAHLTFDETPGLRLEATQTRRTWVYRYKSPHDGRMRQVRIGHWPALSHPAAVVAWEALRAQRDAGVDVAADRRTARQAEGQRIEAARAEKRVAAYTVQRVCLDYIDGALASGTPKYVAESRRIVDKMLGSTADLPAATLTRAQAFDLIERHLAIPVTAVRLRQLLGAAWDHALDAGRLPESAVNWWRLIMRGKLKSKGKRLAGEHQGPAKRVLTGAEVGQLVRWLPNLSRTLEDVLTLYLWTACRGSEICAMEAHELAVEADGVLWWTVPLAKLKMRRNPLTTDLRVPLFGRARLVVERRLGVTPAGWLFPSMQRGGLASHVEQKAVQTSVHYHQPYSPTRPEHVRPRLPVTHWAPHDLRRTSRTLLAAMGCPDAVGEAILGHKPAGLVGVYNRHDYDAERAHWLQLLSERLEGLVVAKG